MKKYIYLTLVSFSVTLAAVIGWRLSSDALTLAAGVVLGILTMVPALLALTWAVRFLSRAQPNPGQSAQPPVVVVGGMPATAPPSQLSQPPASPLPPPPPPTQRHWEMRVYDEL
jgi:hypothetical protein